MELAKIDYRLLDILLKWASVWPAAFSLMKKAQNISYLVEPLSLKQEIRIP